MSILDFFSSAKEAKLASDMVDKLVIDLPPALMQSQNTKFSVNRVTRLLERSYQLALKHASENRMGFVKRAILANKLKWGLLERGYPSAFADVAVEGLVMALAKKKVS